MTTYAKAIYDFNGEPGTSEITIKVGEVLTVLHTDVGEGWWEGKNVNGAIGLFPAAYVQIVSAAEAAQAAGGQAITTSVNQIKQNNEDGNRYDATEDDYNDGDDWEDDWDDDNDTYSEIGPSGVSGGTAGMTSRTTTNHQNLAMINNYDYKNLPVVPHEDGHSSSSHVSGGNNPQSTNTLRKAGMFGKSSDSYILGLANKEKIPDNEMVYIVPMDSHYYWQCSQQQTYSVVVDSPKKESKFKGMKTFIAYQLTPSFNNISVSRRYKHFDWLHERLVEKFCLIPIPPLPDKQISGRYEEQFVEHRRVQLQEFVDWVCRHPVLSKCNVWMHFLTCTDDKMWKTGKRKAERDFFVGVTYCWAIQPPEKQLLQSYIDGQMESCSQLIHSMDASIRNLLTISNETAKRCQVQYKKEFHRVGDALVDLSRALSIDERRSPAKTTVVLSVSVNKVGEIYKDIGQLYGEQPKFDWVPLSDRFHIYRGILTSFPDILSTHKGAMQKRKECEKLTSEQKMSNAQMADVIRRTDIISYAVLAEMTHFRQERDNHLKQSLKQFIGEQIKFYRNVVAKLENAYQQFD